MILIQTLLHHLTWHILLWACSNLQLIKICNLKEAVWSKFGQRVIAGLKSLFLDNSRVTIGMTWRRCPIIFCLGEYARVTLWLRNTLPFLLSERSIKLGILLSCLCWRSLSMTFFSLWLIDMKDCKLWRNRLSVIRRKFRLMKVGFWSSLLIKYLIHFINLLCKCIILWLRKRATPFISVIAFKLLSIIEFLIRFHHTADIRKGKPSRNFWGCKPLFSRVNSW